MAWNHVDIEAAERPRDNGNVARQYWQKVQELEEKHYKVIGEDSDDSAVHGACENLYTNKNRNHSLYKQAIQMSFLLAK